MLNVQKHIEEMKKVEEYMLNFLDHNDELEENFGNFMSIFNFFKIYDDKHRLKSVLYLLTKISNNHYRKIDFFNKIEKILFLFKETIQKYFTNSEIFHIFKSNKRILLFLLEEGIMCMDEFIIKFFFNEKYLKSNYPQYFALEIKPFMNEGWFNKDWMKYIQIDKDEHFNEKRKIGENDNYICKLIQEDLIEEFIIYINKTSYSLDSSISPSIYETNSILLNKGDPIMLIEYSVFFGSIKVFNYLRLNGVELMPQLWTYAIHGQNAEIIHILEDNQIFLSDASYKECLVEAIKCHHHDIFYYMQNNYGQDEIERSYDPLIDNLKYYNFDLMQNNSIDKSSFPYLCKYDHFYLVDALLKNFDIDLNMKAKYI